MRRRRLGAHRQRQRKDAGVQEQHEESESQRPGRHVDDPVVRRCARAGDDRARDAQGDRRRHQRCGTGEGEQHEQADPLPELDLQESDGEERCRQQVAERPVAELAVQRRDLGERPRRHFPNRGSVVARLSLEEQLHGTLLRRDRGKQFAFRAQAVVGVALRRRAEQLEVHPECALNDGTQLPRQAGTFDGADGLPQRAQVEVLGRPRVVAGIAGVEEPLHGVARRAALKVVVRGGDGGRRLWRRRGVLRRDRCAARQADHQPKQHGHGPPAGHRRPPVARHRTPPRG